MISRLFILSVVCVISHTAYAMDAHREAAIKECSHKAATMRQHTWGVQQLQIYRTCMAQKGEKE